MTPSIKPRKTPPRPHAAMPGVVRTDNEPRPQSRLMFKTEVMQLVGVTYPTLWRWMREEPPRFPLSFDIGSKTAWREDEVNEWLANRPRSNLKKREA